MLEASAETARRFLVARQLLAPPRSAPGVLEVVRRFGSLQYDPIGVAGRSHDLVLHARVAGYEPAWTDELYAQRRLYEAYNKGLSFVPVEDVPWFRATLGRRARRLLEEHAEVAARVLERVRAEGQLSSADFAVDRSAVDTWFGTPTNAVRAVLEALAVTGTLGLARREGTRRSYDLAERLLPAELLAREVPPVEQLRHRMLSRHRAHGLLSASSGNDVYTGLGAAKPDERFPGSPGRRALHASLVEEGAIVPVRVEGVKAVRFVLAEELPLLEAPPEPPPAVAFLSPFDPLVWERKLVGELFGFDHVWELFVPPAKRRFGWYVLPILFGDRLVGRFEPRIDRDAGAVRVLDLWWEEGFSPRRAEGFVAAMDDALRAYLRFAGATRLEWAPRLRAERRLWPC
ncbi:MAG TPA: crosslink repair DNA glycosylase YcaQ family protein [Gaiellaceae bacterium]|nr:crosslink repair DNA glycosylase YcaQ family protein [Gaiellaceae bacterium]